MNALENERDAEACGTALPAVVAQAYRAFRRHAAPTGLLDVCTHCCVPVEIERQLREWPMTRLTGRHFYEYNISAKSEIQPPQELGYLLPRMLELLAAGEEIHHSVELSLDRLGSCPKDSWNADELAVLDRFAAAYFDGVLRGDRFGNDVRRCVDEPLSILLMFDIGGLAIAPLLELWLRCDHPFSTMQFVEETYWRFWEGRSYGNPFASDRPAFRAQVGDWILHPEHRGCFAAKLLAPDFQALARQRPDVGCMPFSLMVDGVFDQLTA